MGSARFGVVWVALLVSCGARQSAEAWHSVDLLEAAPDAITTRDPTVMRNALRGPIVDGGLWFDDAACRTRFAQPRRIETPELDAFARCLAGLGLARSPRHHQLPDVALLTYAPGIEVEAWFAVGPKGVQLVSIGFAGGERTRTWLPTVASEALEPLRIAGDPHAVDDAVRSTIEPYLKGQPPDTFLWAWFKVCVNRDGDVVDVGARDAAVDSIVSGMGLAIRRWKFRPFLLGGQPMPVCSIVLASYPARGPDATFVSVPVLEPATVGVHMPPERLSGTAQVQPTDELKRRIASDYVLVANIQFCIDIEGKVDRVNTYESTGLRDYDAQLVAAIKQWRYRPAQRSDGTPSRACRDVTFVYRQMR